MYQAFLPPHFFDGVAKVIAISISAKFFLSLSKISLRFSVNYLKNYLLFLKADCKDSITMFPDQFLSELFYSHLLCNHFTFKELPFFFKAGCKDKRISITANSFLRKNM